MKIHSHLDKQDHQTMTVLYLLLLLHQYKQKKELEVPLKDEGDISYRKLGNSNHTQPGRNTQTAPRTDDRWRLLCLLF